MLAQNISWYTPVHPPTRSCRGCPYFHRVHPNGFRHITPDRLVPSVTDLCELCRKNDAGELTVFLAHVKDPKMLVVESSTPIGNSPLHLASASDCVEVRLRRERQKVSRVGKRYYGSWNRESKSDSYYIYTLNSSAYRLLTNRLWRPYYTMVSMSMHGPCIAGPRCMWRRCVARVALSRWCLCLRAAGLRWNTSQKSSTVLRCLVWIPPHGVSLPFQLKLISSMPLLPHHSLFSSHPGSSSTRGRCQLCWWRGRYSRPQSFCCESQQGPAPSAQGWCRHSLNGPSWPFPSSHCNIERICW